MKKINKLFPILAPDLALPEEHPAQNLRMFSTSGSGKKPVVRAERRRPAGPGGAKPTGHAEAPVRRRPTQTQQPTSSGYSQPAEGSSYSQPVLRRQLHGIIITQLPKRGGGWPGRVGLTAGLAG